MSKFGVPAIVFGGGINALGIVRNLGREGVDVYCVVDGPDPVISSKYCRRYFVVPNFARREDLLKRFLSRFMSSLKKPAVIFPTSDTATLALAGMGCNANELCLFIGPRRDVAEKLVVKSQFYESLVRRGIKHPRTIAPKCCEHARSAARELGYPVFIRPCVSDHFSKLFGRKGFVARAESELIRYYEIAVRHETDVILQEVVPGPDTYLYGIAGAFDANCRPLALFGYHRLRGWPPMFGNNSLMESVPISRLDHMKRVITEYLSRMGYRGIMEAEFKRDPRDGLYKLLEINARSWWQNSFPTKCGVNIVLKAYLDAIGQENSYSQEYTAGLKWINLVDDMRSSIATRQLLNRSWIHSLSNIKDCAFFDFDDLGPASSRLIDLVGKFRSPENLFGRRVL